MSGGSRPTWLSGEWFRSGLAGRRLALVRRYVERAHRDLRWRRLQPWSACERCTRVAQTFVPATFHCGAQKLIVLGRPLARFGTVDQFDNVHRRLAGRACQELDFGFVLEGSRKLRKQLADIPPQVMSVAKCLHAHAGAAGIANVLLAFRNSLQA